MYAVVDCLLPEVASGAAAVAGATAVSSAPVTGARGGPQAPPPQQGGVFRSDDAGETWRKLSGDQALWGRGWYFEKIAVDPRDPDTAWVFPMDGSGVWPRTSPDGKPAAYVTRDGGRRWRRLDRGLPRGHAWLTVKRQAMSADSHDPVGLYLGTTSGEVWASRDEGGRWSSLARHLPEIYALEVAEPAR